MKKYISIILIAFLLISISFEFPVYATGSNATAMGVDELIGNMKDISKSPTTAKTSKTGNIINNVIGVIQITGTGISLVVISMLGIKYLIASPGEKADVKKNIMPIIIGCALLFAAVNIVGIIESVTHDANLTGS